MAVMRPVTLISSGVLDSSKGPNDSSLVSNNNLSTSITIYQNPINVEGVMDENNLGASMVQRAGPSSVHPILCTPRALQDPDMFFTAIKGFKA